MLPFCIFYIIINGAFTGEIYLPNYYNREIQLLKKIKAIRLIEKLNGN
jgi:hypothetical protein